MPAVSRLRVLQSGDDAFLAWQIDARIPGLAGFAVQRRGTVGGKAIGPVFLVTWVGFAQEAPAAGAFSGAARPSTVWPVQKFTWLDFDVSEGDTLSYQIVPMTGAPGALQAQMESASGWSEPVSISSEGDRGIRVFFNRGIVASQWLARALSGSATPKKTLMQDVTTPGNTVRNMLGGPLRTAMLARLQKAIADQVEVYAALFQLSDPELLPLLLTLGPRLHIVLSNGSVPSSAQDQNSDARAQLRNAKVDVVDRMKANSHFGHNKFVVFCDANGKAAEIWTGSTNWTATGLCTQHNNGILIQNPALAQAYVDYWNRLKAAGNDNTKALEDGNSAVPNPYPVSTGSADFWACPINNLIDIKSASALINQAQHGILFLMFDPGSSGTLLNAIDQRAQASSPTYDANLLIYGVVNQPINNSGIRFGLDTRGDLQTHETNAAEQILTPSNISTAFGYWKDELLRADLVAVHSKIIVLDPFSDHPVVMTGSHNMGPKASSGNDDNLLVLHDCKNIAAMYAVNIMATYHEYRWNTLAHDQKTSPTAWQGLEAGDTWQDKYLADGAEKRELGFWFGG